MVSLALSLSLLLGCWSSGGSKPANSARSIDDSRSRSAVTARREGFTAVDLQNGFRITPATLFGMFTVIGWLNLDSGQVVTLCGPNRVSVIDNWSEMLVSPERGDISCLKHLDDPFFRCVQTGEFPLFMALVSPDSSVLGVVTGAHVGRRAKPLLERFQLELSSASCP